MEPVKVRIAITQGNLVLAELHGEAADGRHEFVFAQPVPANGRQLTGFAVECFLDKEPRHVRYQEFEQPIVYPR